MAGWVLGVFINLVGSILINAGTNLMKLGHNQRAATEAPPHGKAPIHRFRAWQGGVLLFAVGNISNFVSFGFAAQSLLAAIGCIQFVSNVAFASLVLKEKVTWAVLVSTALIVGGCILLVAFGSHASAVYTSHDLLTFYGRAPYVAYMVVSAALVAGAYALYWRGRRRILQVGPQAAGAWVTVLPMVYALFSAIIGTQSVLFSKTLSTLLRATLDGDNQLRRWFTWLVLPLFLASAAFWVTRLNRGLNMFPALVIVPTMQITWTLLSILSGMLYFQEYQGFSPLSGGMFGIGVSVVCSAVVLLTYSSSPRDGGRTVPSSADAPATLDKALRRKASLVGGACLAEDESSDRSVAQLSIAAARQQQSDDGEGEARGHDKDCVPLLSATVKHDSSHVRCSCCPEASPGGPNAQPGGGEDTVEGELTPPPLSPAPREGERIDGPLLEGRSVLEVVAGLHRKLRRDFSLDQTAAARLLVGLGPSSDRPALSIFGMPMPDMGMHDPQDVLYAQRLATTASRGHRSTAVTAAESAPSSGRGSGDDGDLLAGPLRAEASQLACGGINPLSNAIDVFPTGGKAPGTALSMHSHTPGLMHSLGAAAHRVETSVGSAAGKLRASLERAVDAADSRLAGLAGGTGGGGARRGGYMRMEAWGEPIAEVGRGSQQSGDGG